jgi:two-component system C4-dicarboxylate transport sensor histidine kinase DctB
MLVTLHDITERKKQETALREARSRLEQRVDERTADLMATNIRLQAEIEERAKAEDALRQTQDQLVQAAKLASLGQMSASISHELNQPLAAIRTYADNARKLLGRDRTDDANWNLLQIGFLTDRMARISSQLKAFSRKASGTSESVSLSEAVRVTVEIAAAAVKKAGVRLTVSEIPADVKVWADRLQLEQVLLNLVTNGVQAAADSEHREVSIQVAAEGDRVKLLVADSGPGIASAHMNETFDPFFTTKEAGLGLGLSICQQLVESMNGSLSAANAADGGAVFILTLPVAGADNVVLAAEGA